MPSRHQIAGQLLDDANVAVMERLKGELHGEYAVLASDGWKDESRDLVNGVNVSVSGKVRFHVISATILTYYWEFWVKTYLIDLILATSHKKDGESMCKAFEAMIDKAEDQYGVVVVARTGRLSWQISRMGTSTRNGCLGPLSCCLGARKKSELTSK
jgi:hypothetical protein